MENTQNNRLEELIKENEKIVLEFTKELQCGLSQKTMTIDGIETIMVKTLLALKRSMIATTEKIMNDESKKKLKLKSMINAEEQ